MTLLKTCYYIMSLVHQCLWLSIESCRTYLTHIPLTPKASKNEREEFFSVEMLSHAFSVKNIVPSFWQCRYDCALKCTHTRMFTNHAERKLYRSIEWIPKNYFSFQLNWMAGAPQTKNSYQRAVRSLFNSAFLFIILGSRQKSQKQ